ncbi:hypothetical protein BC6307_21530 [Sutcliffiella cohnii]|uniref:Lipoprotein n=2 Tax=Sutcliffiella cohnii TaxID=33932 RepID=A0A223KWB0_9BACI|nr:hypothetical protein [Sutcliffiella cohnii]AST93663.1 hypothetical protein BC6307_21530 [Sutcliffiella cohnii]
MRKKFFIIGFLFLLILTACSSNTNTDSITSNDVSNESTSASSLFSKSTSLNNEVQEKQVHAKRDFSSYVRGGGDLWGHSNHGDPYKIIGIQNARNTISYDGYNEGYFYINDEGTLYFVPTNINGNQEEIAQAFDLLYKPFEIKGITAVDLQHGVSDNALVLDNEGYIHYIDSVSLLDSEIILDQIRDIESIVKMQADVRTLVTIDKDGYVYEGHLDKDLMLDRTEYQFDTNISQILSWGNIENSTKNIRVTPYLFLTEYQEVYFSFYDNNRYRNWLSEPVKVEGLQNVSRIIPTGATYSKFGEDAFYSVYLVQLENGEWRSLFIDAFHHTYQVEENLIDEQYIPWLENIQAWDMHLGNLEAILGNDHVDTFEFSVTTDREIYVKKRNKVSAASSEEVKRFEPFVDEIIETMWNEHQSDSEFGKKVQRAFRLDETDTLLDIKISAFSASSPATSYAYAFALIENRVGQTMIESGSFLIKYDEETNEIIY